jgi:hypothetical protein
MDLITLKITIDPTLVTEDFIADHVLELEGVEHVEIFGVEEVLA